MKIGIIGAGAMGCLFACLLSGTQDVTLYDVSRETVDAINTRGVRCRGAGGEERRCSVPAALSGSSAASADLVILFVKDTVSRSALAGNTGLIGPGTLLLSLQNGMGNLEIMEDFAPRQRLLLGTTKHNCVSEGPGCIFHSGAGDTHIGSPDGSTARAQTVAAVFSAAGIRTLLCPDVNHLLWEKLFLNAAVNPVTALLDCRIGVIAEDPGARAITRALIEEAVAVAEADGQRFDREQVFQTVMTAARTLSAGRASMCQDIRQGRQTEIDFINGAVVRLGEKYGIPTPRHSLITALIHTREALAAEKRSN